VPCASCRRSPTPGDVVTFPAGGGTIALTSTVDVQVGVELEGCSDPNAIGPCVRLQAPGGFDALDVNAPGGGVTVRGLRSPAPASAST
jgi:hypothetical protein